MVIMVLGTVSWVDQKLHFYRWAGAFEMIAGSPTGHKILI